jgi:Flp pilus assembly protein TadD
MPKTFWRWALLYVSTCLITGCEGGALKSFTHLDAGPVASETAAFSSPAEAVQKAETLRLAGAEIEALAVLAAAYRRYPNHGGVLSAYGRLALAMGHDELAARLLQTALAADPRDARALSAQGVLAWRNGRASEAQGALIRAKAVSPEDSAVLNNLAVGYLLDGRPAEAVPLLREALAAIPARSAHAGRIQRNLAVALAVQGEFTEADRLAQATLPRSLQNADAGKIRRFMGLGDAPADRQSGWEAHFADAGQAWPERR